MQRIRLHDGRFLGFTEYGTARGFPLFFLHDSGSSRMEAAFFDFEARRKGFRLIALDRPGVGGSDPLPAFTREDCAYDLLQLADYLRCARFGLLGIGSGSAIALVTAAMEPQRARLVLGLSSQLPGCATVSNRAFHSMLRVLLHWAIGLRLHVLSSSPGRYLERLCETLSFADRRLLDNPGIREQVVRVAEEAVRSGGSGVARDMVLALAPLTLASHRLQMPIHLWQGSAESSASHQAQREFSETLPNCKLHRLNNRGRYFYWRHTEEVFAVANALASSTAEKLSPVTRQDKIAISGTVAAVALAG